MACVWFLGCMLLSGLVIWVWFKEQKYRAQLLLRQRLLRTMKEDGALYEVGEEGVGGTDEVTWATEPPVMSGAGGGAIEGESAFESPWPPWLFGTRESGRKSVSKGSDNGGGVIKLKERRKSKMSTV
jgi:hypothetical protein